MDKGIDGRWKMCLSENEPECHVEDTGFSSLFKVKELRECLYSVGRNLGEREG